MTDILKQANEVLINFDAKRHEKARQVYKDAFLTACFLLDGDGTVKNNREINSVIGSAVRACANHMSEHCTVDALSLELQFMLTYLALYTTHVEMQRPLEAHEITQVAGMFFDAHIWDECVR